MATNRSRYQQLEDKAWLEERYINRMQSIGQIGAEIGCQPSSVARALKRCGIDRRIHTSKYAQLNDKEWLRAQYVDERKSTHQIARDVGAPEGVVHSALTWAGIEIRTSKEGWREKFPEGRDGDKHPRWKGGRVETGKAVTQYQKRMGAQAGHWKGGRNIIPTGYIYVYAHDHPKATVKGYVMEHRLVMEQHLGRYLERGEVVHHKNGDKQDNRIENLELFTNAEHVSTHFQESYMAEQLKVRISELERRIAELEEELGRYR